MDGRCAQRRPNISDRHRAYVRGISPGAPPPTPPPPLGTHWDTPIAKWSVDASFRGSGARRGGVAAGESWRGQVYSIAARDGALQFDGGDKYALPSVARANLFFVCARSGWGLRLSRWFNHPGVSGWVGGWARTLHFFLAVVFFFFAALICRNRIGQARARGAVFAASGCRCGGVAVEWISGAMHQETVWRNRISIKTGGVQAVARVKQSASPSMPALGPEMIRFFNSRCRSGRPTHSHRGRMVEADYRDDQRPLFFFFRADTSSRPSSRAGGHGLNLYELKQLLLVRDPGSSLFLACKKQRD